jgi:hypothetical protein
MKKIFLILLLFALNINSGYYIDFAAGSDAAAGTKVAPWKHYIGMRNVTGNPHTFTKSIGSPGTRDTFFFKGGVTWDSTCFPMTIDSLATYDRSNYTLTVDSTWYTGGSFTRPIFNVMKKQIPAAFGVIHCGSKTKVTLNCFHITNVKAVTGEGTGNPQVFVEYGGDSIIITNCQIDSIYPDPSYATYPGSLGGDDNMAAITCSAYPNATYTKIDNNIITGRDSGFAGVFIIGTANNGAQISNNTISHMANGVYVSATSNNNTQIYNNNISYIKQGGLNAGEHTNGIFVYGPGNGSIYNNKVHHSTTPQGIWENGGQWKVYNNAFYSNNNSFGSGASLGWEVPEGSLCPSCSLWLWNNYSEYNFVYTVRSNSNTGFMQIKNNIIGNIVNGGFGANLVMRDDTIKHLYIDYNLYTGVDSASVTGYLDISNGGPLSPHAALLLGYDAHSYWRVNPLVDTVGTLQTGSIALHHGVNLSSYFTTDITGLTRGTNWSIGPYDSSGSGPIDSIAYWLALAPDTIKMGNAIFSATYTVNVPIQCKYAVFQNGSVSTISKGIQPRDSLVYNSSSTVTASAGSGIYPKTGYTLTIKLNGKSTTPTVHKGSVRWK